MLSISQNNETSTWNFVKFFGLLFVGCLAALLAFRYVFCLWTQRRVFVPWGNTPAPPARTARWYRLAGIEDVGPRPIELRGNPRFGPARQPLSQDLDTEAAQEDAFRGRVTSLTGSVQQHRLQNPVVEGRAELRRPEAARVQERRRLHHSIQPLPANISLCCRVR